MSVLELALGIALGMFLVRAKDLLFAIPKYVALKRSQREVVQSIEEMIKVFDTIQLKDSKKPRKAKTAKKVK